MKIDISADLIETASRRDSSHCMIAEAVKQAVPEAKHVSVDIQTIRYTLPAKGLRFTYLTPRSVQDALVAFDQGEVVPAFAFNLQHAQVTKAKSKRLSAAPTDAPEEMRNRMARLATRRAQIIDGQRQGGTPPPLAGHGRRREFGLRTMAR